MSNYEVDIYAWSQRQGALLRRLAAGDCVNRAHLDWSNIAEEIETVGRSERRAVTRHISNIIEHLVLLQASPSTKQRAEWLTTIDRSRMEIEQLLEDSPSLRKELPALVSGELPRARRLARNTLEQFDQQAMVDLEVLAFSDVQVLGDWSPDAP